MTVRVWLKKHFRNDEGQYIPRGRYIDVEQSVAAFLEANDRAVRAEKTEDIKAYEDRVEKIIQDDRAKRVAKKK